MIGRLVAFRDPIYAEAAWAAGDRDQVVQTPDGDMFSTYGGFTNFAHEGCGTTTGPSRSRPSRWA